jgi:galactonate dehydratase
VVADRVAAVREAVGPDVDIIIENHSFLDAQSAIQLGRAVREYNIYFFEEPNTPDPDTAKYISENMDVPIAGGERIYTRWQYAKYLNNNSLQVVQPDLGTCGGITEVKKICDMAYIYDVAVQIHACASPLCLAAAMHIETAIPHFLIHEHHQVYICDFNKKLCIYDYQPKNGFSAVPEKPGIGNELSDFVLNQKTHTVIEGHNILWSM